MDASKVSVFEWMGLLVGVPMGLGFGVAMTLAAGGKWRLCAWVSGVLVGVGCLTLAVVRALIPWVGERTAWAFEDDEVLASANAAAGAFLALSVVALATVGAATLLGITGLVLMLRSRVARTPPK